MGICWSFTQRVGFVLCAKLVEGRDAGNGRPFGVNVLVDSIREWEVFMIEPPQPCRRSCSQFVALWLLFSKLLPPMVRMATITDGRESSVPLCLTGRLPILAANPASTTKPG